MAARRRTGAARKHPTGTIREVAQHIFVSGAAGTGTTTTLVPLVDAALANGYVVVIVDSKGVELGSGGLAS